MQWCSYHLWFQLTQSVFVPLQLNRLLNNEIFNGLVIMDNCNKEVSKLSPFIQISLNLGNSKTGNFTEL